MKNFSFLFRLLFVSQVVTLVLFLLLCFRSRTQLEVNNGAQLLLMVIFNPRFSLDRTIRKLKFENSLEMKMERHATNNWICLRLTNLIQLCR